MHEAFSPFEVDQILNVPLLPHVLEDHLFWKDTKNGIDSIKLGYHLLMNLSNAGATARSSNSLRRINF